MQIWDPMLRSHHPLLSSFVFPSPAQMTHAAFDPLERCFFAAAYNASTGSSKVYKADLYRRTRKGEQEDEEDAPLGKRYEAIGGGGRGDLERVSAEDRPGRTWSSPGASKERISSMFLSSLSSHLLVGTSTGSIYVLSLPSLQAIRVIIPSQSSATASLMFPITYIRTLLRPSDLISRTGAGAGRINDGTTREDGVQPRTVCSQLSRTLIQQKDLDEHVVFLRIGYHQDVTDIVTPPCSTPFVTRDTSLYSNVGVGDGQGHLDQLQSLQDSNARLREQLARSVAVNERMWEGLVDRTLAEARMAKTAEAVASTRTNGQQQDGMPVDGNER